ncbi:MG284/MPN403 family protein [Mycoplasmopsis lipofaciens]|uniref:MG284/MPN403 family protein n=1 Tax=Mycoplasmopsis lipofaciens TaxID=114884 RepID=UPI000481A06E|nr:hypothetical protein [Mycoplasmopsis lipofaciens]
MYSNFNQYFMGLLSTKDKVNAIKTICKLEDANECAKLKKINNANLDLNKKITLPLNKLNKVLRLLSKNSLLIIRNDFINKYKSKNWFEQYFSKTTYYKYKREALEEFLYLYVNE